MGNKVVAALVVTFWGVMMTTLVRVELLATRDRFGTVPMTRVLRKMFANTEPARLNIYYRKAYIGSCHVEIDPLATRDATASESAGLKPGAYQVKTDLLMSLASFGTAGQLHVVGSSILSPRYELQEFKAKATLGGNYVEVQGDDRTHTVSLRTDFGGEPLAREFDFRELSMAGLTSVLGLPALTGARPGGTARTADWSDSLFRHDGPPARTQVFQTMLPLGELSQRGYLIETKLDELLWSRLWVDETGQILLVETSTGITLRSEVIDVFSGPPIVRGGKGKGP